MKTELLRKALLEYQKQQNLSADDQLEISNALVEIDDIDQKIGSEDVWQHDCYLLHAAAADDLLNNMLYDTYGKLFAANHARPEYTEYFEAVEKLLPTLSTQLVNFSYDIIADLYDENETNGYHNIDGSFLYNRDRLECQSLENLLQAVTAQFNTANDQDCFSFFSIKVGNSISTFILGCPQYEALIGFIEHLAGENLHSVDFNNLTVTGIV